jgi:hypothetical protein
VVFAEISVFLNNLVSPVLSIVAAVVFCAGLFVLLPPALARLVVVPIASFQSIEINRVVVGLRLRSLIYGYFLGYRCVVVVSNGKWHRCDLGVSPSPHHTYILLIQLSF